MTDNIIKALTQAKPKVYEKADTKDLTVDELYVEIENNVGEASEEKPPEPPPTLVGTVKNNLLVTLVSLDAASKAYGKNPVVTKIKALLDHAMKEVLILKAQYDK